MKFEAILITLMLGLSLVWWSCSTQGDTKQPAPYGTTQDERTKDIGTLQSGEMPSFRTLAEIAADPNTNLIAEPVDYNLEKAGLWPYSEAYGTGF